MNSTYALETLALHGGQAPDPTTGSRAVPIYQSTSFVFHSSEHARALFALDEPGHIYTRIGNPTTDVFEKRMALLEDGVAAVATASGQAAIALSILNLAQAGDEIVASNQLYGGTFNLFAVTLPRYGIQTRWVDLSDTAQIRAAINEKTRAVFAEIIGNPGLGVLDIETVADIAHEAGVPLIVDNTFATPALCRPITWGADIVVHSATKWLGGHGNSIGGVVVDGGRFDWTNPRFPNFNRPDPSYHGVRYATDFGTLAFITKLRVQLLRDLGPCLSPFNAFLILQGVETLTLRMERHCRNAAEIAERLAAHPAVAWVNYPARPDHPSYALAQRYLGGHGGGVVTFGIRGGTEAGRHLINRVQLWSHVANVGDAKSLIIHPASTTHQQLSDEDRRRSGVGDDLVRLSVGLEAVEDLWLDLDRALREATGLGGIPVPPINDEATIRWMLQSSLNRVQRADGTVETRPKSIAVVGLSSNPARPSHRIARKLQRLGYRIIPVNPREKEVLGEPSWPSITALEETPDAILVFRGAEAAVELAREASALPRKPRLFWLQEGVISEAAAQIAREAGYAVVHNRCMYREAQRLRGSIATYACER